MKNKLPLTTDPRDIALYVRQVRELIDQALPAGSVVPQHTADGHFYGVPSGAVYPSVTGKLNAVKDESIQSWSVNQAVSYIENNLPATVVDGKVHLVRAAELFDAAKKEPRVQLRAAGDIGTQVHDRREQYFQHWIDSDVIDTRPHMSLFMRPDDDPRLTAGLLALDKFLNDTGYIPIRTEVMVYSNKYKVAGMLDDIGLMRNGKNWSLTLLDLKTSNQMKAHYWLQVALYNMMFKDITGLKPHHNIILKVSKDLPEYKIEEISEMHRVIAGAKHVLQVYDTMEFIKAKRKNIGKTVVKI